MVGQLFMNSISICRESNIDKNFSLARRLGSRTYMNEVFRSFLSLGYTFAY